jgi:hypothetical protein
MANFFLLECEHTTTLTHTHARRHGDQDVLLSIEKATQEQLQVCPVRATAKLHRQNSGCGGLLDRIKLRGSSGICGSYCCAWLPRALRDCCTHHRLQ